MSPPAASGGVIRPLVAGGFQRIMLTGPSGVGKSTIAQALVARRGYGQLRSHTTRPIRPNEPRTAYHFVTEKEFIATPMVEQMQYHGNRYGLSRAALEEECSHNTVIHAASCDTFEAYHPLGFRSILLTAPSTEALRSRLVGRDGHEGRFPIALAEHNAIASINTMAKAHACVMNDDLELAIEHVLGVIDAWAKEGAAR